MDAARHLDDQQHLSSRLLAELAELRPEQRDEALRLGDLEGLLGQDAGILEDPATVERLFQGLLSALGPLLLDELREARAARESAA